LRVVNTARGRDVEERVRRGAFGNSVVMGSGGVVADVTIWMEMGIKGSSERRVMSEREVDGTISWSRLAELSAGGSSKSEVVRDGLSWSRRR
jgi:hypothetical protein